MKCPCSRTLLVRLSLFRRSGYLCSNLFSTDNLAKSGFPGEILSHGSLSPCPSQRLVGLKGIPLEAHLLEPHLCTSPQPRIFKSISSKLMQMLCAVAVPQGTSVCAAGQEPAQPGAHPGVALLLPSPSPMLLRFLVIFPQPRVRKRPRGSCCSRACWQQEPHWLPGDWSQAGRGTLCAHRAPAQAAGTPWLPKKPIRQVSHPSQP